MEHFEVPFSDNSIPTLTWKVGLVKNLEIQSKHISCYFNFM